MNKKIDYLSAIFPTISGIISFLLFLWIGEGYKLKGIDDVIGSIINFSSIIIGFYSAMYGILLTLKDSDIMRKFKENDLESHLKWQLYESLIFSFLILITSIALQVIINYDNIYRKIFFYFWAFVLGYFTLVSFGTISLLVKIMFNNTQKKMESTKDEISEEKRNEMIKKMERE